MLRFKDTVCAYDLRLWFKVKFQAYELRLLLKENF
jgi:hypothetical protein